MIVYAQPPDLLQWVDVLPDDPQTMLQYATVAVAKACQLSLYGPEPAEPAADILRDATCIQAASWVTLGVDPAKAGTDLPGPVKSSTILGATVAMDTTAAAAAAADARDGLCALATDLLQTNGLLYVPVPLGDTIGCLPRWGLDVPLAVGVPFEQPYGYDWDFGVPWYGGC